MRHPPLCHKPSAIKTPSIAPVFRAFATVAIAGIALFLMTTAVQADPFQGDAIPLPWLDSGDVAVADFNRDGLADVAALNSYGPHHAECNGPPGPITCGDRMLLTIHLSLGDRSFAPMQSIITTCAPTTMATGDFNDDGFTDVVVGSRGARDAFGICWQPGIAFYPGNGAGGFGTPTSRVTGGEPTDSAAGDLDGDGEQEVVMVYGSDGTAQIFQVSAAGALAPGPLYTAGSPLSSVATGDLDDDSIDEVVIGFETGSTVTLLERSPVTGGLVPVEAILLIPDPPGGPPRSLVVADVTADFVPDIAIGRGGIGTGLTLLTRDGNGSYGNPAYRFNSPMNGAAYGQDLAAADLNFDGFVDLATTDGGSHLQTLIGDGTGHFTGSAPITSANGHTAVIAAGDFDGDALPDLVTGGSPFLQPVGTLYLYFNETPVTDVMLIDVMGQDDLEASGHPVDWYGVFGATGYDLVRGDLATLQSTGDYAASVEACVASGIPWSNGVVPGDPPVGKAWWILGRPRFAGGPGTYDDWGEGLDGPRDPGINASPAACP